MSTKRAIINQDVPKFAPTLAPDCDHLTRVHRGKRISPAVRKDALNTEDAELIAAVQGDVGATENVLTDLLDDALYLDNFTFPE